MPPSNEEEAAAFASSGSGGTGATIRGVMEGLSAKWLDPSQDSNPRFDGRQRRRSNAGGTGRIPGLFRGYLTQMREEHVAIPQANGTKRRKVNFLYNPTTVAVNYGIDTSVFPEQSRALSDTSPVLGATSQTVSFTLYFNRMYESREYNNKGVLADVQALEYLLGSHNGSGMQATEVAVVLGASEDNTPFSYAGWISDLNIEYLQFTHRMIPTVAMVQVGMVRRLIGEHAGTGGGGNGLLGEQLQREIDAIFDALPGQSGSSGRTAGPRIPSTGRAVAQTGGHTGGGTTTRPI